GSFRTAVRSPNRRRRCRSSSAYPSSNVVRGQNDYRPKRQREQEAISQPGQFHFWLPRPSALDEHFHVVALACVNWLIFHLNFSMQQELQYDFWHNLRSNVVDNFGRRSCEPIHL